MEELVNLSLEEWKYFESGVEIGYLRTYFKLRLEPYSHPGKHEIYTTLARHPVIISPSDKKWCVTAMS